MRKRDVIATQSSDVVVDRAGVVASGLCAVHCVACALIPVAFGVMGLGTLLGVVAEWIFTAVAVTFGLGALALSWRRHRMVSVAVLLVSGVAGLLIARGIELRAAHLDHSEDAAHVQPRDPRCSGHEAHLVPDDRRDRRAAARPMAPCSDTSIVSDRHHLASLPVGVLAGVFLIWGHLLNLRASRRCHGRHT